jgi:twitching motility protein PilT
MDISKLLTFSAKEGASDCHISAGEPPMIRLHGDLKKLDHPPLTAEETHALVYDMMSDAQRKNFEGEARVRLFIRIGRHRSGSASTSLSRIVDSAPCSGISRPRSFRWRSSGLPPVVRQLCDKEKGPDPRDRSNRLRQVHHRSPRWWITSTTPSKATSSPIEDPIEFVHKTKKCLVNQRELGVHTLSFTNALRSALREDPDIILVGEMRDLETIQLALTAAETGHLVFGTLHTSSAPKTIDRIIDAFPPAQQSQIRTQLSEALEAVITQTLLKKKAGGRVAALEVMVATTAVRNLIREGKLHQIPGIMQASQKDGMQTMDMALVELATRGLVTKNEAQSRSMTPNLFGASAFTGAA